MFSSGGVFGGADIGVKRDKRENLIEVSGDEYCKSMRRYLSTSDLILKAKVSFIFEKIYMGRNLLYFCSEAHIGNTKSGVVFVLIWAKFV